MTKITRKNIDQLLDAGKIQIAITNGKWWTIRRNGATRRWIKDPERIRVPIKFGLRLYDVITEHEFDDGVLCEQYYRVKEEEEATGSVVKLRK